MKILVCGASGLIGSNAMKVFSQNGWEAFGTYFSHELPGLFFLDTLHLTDAEIDKVVSIAPDVIMHCGALTHVDYCETHPEESYEKTVQSTVNLVSLAQKVSARFVYLSTDYVFDGGEGPYIETDIVNPLSIYGKHKLEAEQHVRAHIPDHIIARVTNVYGEEDRDKNFVSRIINQAKGDSEITLRLPKDQYATPTCAYDIASALYCLLDDSATGTFHLAGLEYMNRVDLALEVMKHFPDRAYVLEAQRTEDLAQDALRPLRAGLLRIKFSDMYPDFKWTSVSDFVRQQLGE